MDYVEMFLKDVATEDARARAKFPGNRNQVVALTEEVGELSRALLDLEHGDSSDDLRVYQEAVQVAAMAVRVALDGDSGFGKYVSDQTCRLASVVVKK